jgi:hypothetical protein
MSDPIDPPDDSSFSLLSDVQNSPAEESARALVDSSPVKPTREFTALVAMLARREDLPQWAKLIDAAAPAAKALAHLKRIAEGSEFAKALACIKPIDIDPSFASAFAQMKSMEIPPEFARTISEAQKALSNFSQPNAALAKMIDAIKDQNHAIQRSLLASLGGSFNDIVRVNQWTSMLAKIEQPEISKFYTSLPTVATEVGGLHDSLLKSLTGSIAEDQKRLSAMLGLGQEMSASLEATRFKMSAFAGITDMLGVQTRAWHEAYRSLFGEWRTHTGLPEDYWRDPTIRRQMYDAAEVDPGLARAELGAAVEVIVESGLATGVRSEVHAIALITVGDVSMSIHSRDARIDAYKVLGQFEEGLRAHITRKLSEKFGPDWFKLRVDGNIAGEAKRIRQQALERGEQRMPMINYTELGHLLSIVTGRKNWEEVFGAVFINRGEFDVDMQKLIAARRPTMHIRPIDGVRLVEMICVVQRLSRQMQDDGAWKIAAEFEQ